MRSITIVYSHICVRFSYTQLASINQSNMFTTLCFRNLIILRNSKSEYIIFREICYQLTDHNIIYKL